MSNERWQQEMQEEQEAEILSVLHRVSLGIAGDREALILASHFGLLKEYQQRTIKRERRVA